MIKRVSRLRKAIFISLIIVLFIVVLLPIGGVFFLLREGFDYYMSLNDWKNKYKPTAELSELNWRNIPPKIYYLKSGELYSRVADGSMEKLVFGGNHGESVYNYFLIDKSKNIVIFTNHKVYLTDENGENKSLVFESKDSDGDIGSIVRLSPNQDFIAFFFQPNRQLQVPKLYVFDISKSKLEELADDQHFLTDHPGGFMDGFYWLKDNEVIIWREENYVYSGIGATGHSPTLTQVVSTNVRTKKSNLISEYKHAAVSGTSAKKANLAIRVGEENLVLPEMNTYDPQLSYSNNEVYSENETHLLTVKDSAGEGKLLVDNKEVFRWENWAKKARAFSNFNWLPDGKHIIFEEVIDNLRILDIETGKTAILSNSDINVSGYPNPKWFGKKTNVAQPVDW